MYVTGSGTEVRGAVTEGMHQSLPCVKGGAAHVGRRRDCCIVQGFCNALLDYLAAHSRKPLRKTGPWGAIPQSATLTAPFTQRGPCAVRKCVPFPLPAQVRQSIPLSSPARARQLRGALTAPPVNSVSLIEQTASLSTFTCTFFWTAVDFSDTITG